MTEAETKYAAQDAIMAAVVAAALAKDEAGEPTVATAIRREGARLAKRYGISDIAGLPKTFKGV